MRQRKWIERFTLIKLNEKPIAVNIMSSSTGKRKEIYKYLAPWPLYSMNWSVRPDKRFRLALGSFIEEYNNKVQIISLDEETSEFSAKRWVIGRREMFTFPFLLTIIKFQHIRPPISDYKNYVDSRFKRNFSRFACDKW